jgi:ribonuclease HI
MVIILMPIKGITQKGITHMICVYTDGASRGNPGKAAAGFMIFRGEKKISEEFRCMGIATNNEAEYTAMIMAMNAAKGMGTNEDVTFFSDSELLIKQLTGIYRVKSDRLRKLYEAVKKLESELPNTHIYYKNLPRGDERISAVDRKLNLLLDSLRMED